MTFLVEVPLPPQGVQQNNRRHWRDTAAATKQYREDSAKAARLAMQSEGFDGFTGPVTVSATFFMGLTQQERTRKTAVAEAKKQGKKAPKQKPLIYRPRDVGNAIGALKAAIDGLKDAGLIREDDNKHLDWGKVKLLRAPHEHGGRSGVLLVLTSTEGEAS
jgi:Holliday junction resolvase RusA-like endonuclease